MYLLGVDAGGSRTSAALTDLHRQPQRVAESAGANPNVHGVDQAFRTLEFVIGQVADTIDPAEVSGCVIGIAGYSHTGFQELFPAFIDHFGFGDRCALVPDYDVAFAAGSDEPSGILLLVGTGAIAAKIADHHIVRSADGAGWLLGDEGGGFWLGREAVSAVLRALDGRAEATALAERLAGALDISLDRNAFLSVVYSQPPIYLARLAPVVMTVAAEGDMIAMDIVRRAAECLLASVAALGPFTADERELVLAGSVLRTRNPLSDLVIDQLRDRFDLTVKIADDGALGAAAFAHRLMNARHR